MIYLDGNTKIKYDKDKHNPIQGVCVIHKCTRLNFESEKDLNAESSENNNEIYERKDLVL